MKGLLGNLSGIDFDRFSKPGSMNPDYQRELLAFEEKIALAELEESKAHERVQELKYQKARFSLEAFIVALRQQQQAQMAQQVTSGTPVDIGSVNA